VRRIRTIKPELLEDEKAASLSHEAWRLFVSCLLLADDYGNLRGNTKWIEGQVFWARDAKVEKAIDELVEAGMLARYSVRGQPYITVCNWSKHQRVDKPSKPIIPAPSEDDGTPSRDSRETVASPRETLDSDRDLDRDLDHDHDLEQKALVELKLDDDRFEKVFSHYRKYHPRSLPKVKSTSKEYRAVRARFAEGYSAADLCEAIDGIHVTPHNMGQNEQGTQFLALELCLRNAGQVDRFRENARNPPKQSPTSKGAQQTIEALRAVEAYNARVRQAGSGMVRDERDQSLRALCAPTRPADDPGVVEGDVDAFSQGH
jgi:hypothetical protein